MDGRVKKCLFYSDFEKHIGMDRALNLIIARSIESNRPWFALGVRAQVKSFRLSEGKDVVEPGIIIHEMNSVTFINRNAFYSFTIEYKCLVLLTNGDVFGLRRYDTAKGKQYNKKCDTLVGSVFHVIISANFVYQLTG